MHAERVIDESKTYKKRDTNEREIQLCRDMKERERCKERDIKGEREKERHEREREIQLYRDTKGEKHI